VAQNNAFVDRLERRHTGQFAQREHPVLVADLHRQGLGRLHLVTPFL
jgi:hypothetical protein